MLLLLYTPTTLTELIINRDSWYLVPAKLNHREPHLHLSSTQSQPDLAALKTAFAHGALSLTVHLFYTAANSSLISRRCGETEL